MMPKRFLKSDGRTDARDALAHDANSFSTIHAECGSGMFGTGRLDLDYCLANNANTKMTKAVSFFEARSLLSRQTGAT